MLRQRILSLGLHKQLTYSRPIHQLHHAHSRPPSTQNLRLLRAYRSSAIHRNPSNTLQATPFEPFVNGTVPPTNLFKAIIFTGVFSAGCYAGATILEYENARQIMLDRARQTKFAFFRKAKEAQGYWQDVKRECQGYWDHLTPGQKVFAPICALNVLVFALWRVPKLSNTMMTYFCSNPAGRALCWPMFLSTFSHYSLFHICANMYVLHSFCNAAVQTLGKEQFLGVYLTAGVVASLTSVLYKAVTFQPGLSIGASGAIMAVLGYVCSKYPDMGMSIVFLPMIQFPAGAAIKVIMAVDIVGCVMRWKFFDHAAHLGGALFGVFWAHYGAQIWSQRVTLLSKYHDWRRTR